MNKSPTVYTPAQLQSDFMTSVSSKSPNFNHYVQARPENRSLSVVRRLRLAWLVFTGRCDVLQWEQGQ